MPGGSHNRISRDSLSHALGSRGKMRLCKCPLHRNKGQGILLPQTEFKRHGRGSVQGMCATGKTLIDSYSHMLKRLQLLAVVRPSEIKKAFKGFDKKYNIIILKINEIIHHVLSIKKDARLSASEFKLFLLTRLDERLKTRETGFYDADLLPQEKIEFNESLKKIFTEGRLRLMEIIQARWTRGGFVLDSKDSRLYPVENFAFNVSKKREFYAPDKKITPYRINVHNTTASGQRSSTLRGEKYLADGEYTEANRRMKEIGASMGKMIHADHFIPLALGGIHDPKNLRPLPGLENIYKKDKLTLDGFKLLKEDLRYLSHWHHAAFNQYKADGLMVVQEALRDSVDKLREFVIAMDYDEKLRFIKKVYPAYKESQIKRIIKKHFASNEDSS